MDNLRPVSPRPEIVVDDRSRRVEDAANSQLGLAGPLGRERCLYALPLNGSGPVQWAAAVAVRDHASSLLADTGLDLIGQDRGVWISRLLTARAVEDTRRL